jgi:2-polyprenyl-3-methyl-5-hydroxy-6-metoxy-1,4-benzoquinol methylase
VSTARMQYARTPVSWHPQGFPVFLPVERVATSDEYATGDPYTVGENFDSANHQRRVAITTTLVQRAAVVLGRAPIIVDIGCGEGHLTERVRQALPQATIAGCDYSVSAITYATSHYPSIAFAVADAYDCPYPAGSVDIAILNNIWEHVPDPVSLLTAVTRVLTADGFVVISTPSRYRVWNLVRVLVGKPVVLMSKHHVTEYTVGQVVEQLRYGGYTLRMVTSKRIPMADTRLRIARAVFSVLRKLTRSHHELEGTVFYLAQRNP